MLCLDHPRCVFFLVAVKKCVLGTLLMNNAGGQAPCLLPFGPSTRPLKPGSKRTRSSVRSSILSCQLRPTNQPVTAEEATAAFMKTGRPSERKARSVARQFHICIPLFIRTSIDRMLPVVKTFFCTRHSLLSHSVPSASASVVAPTLGPPD
jgi:hypothetical protein